MKKPKRITRSRSNASTDTTSTFIQQSDELDGNKKSKRITRNGSTTSTNKNIPISIKQTNKKQQVYSVFFYFPSFKKNFLCSG
jgi:hypothetical protein